MIHFMWGALAAAVFFVGVGVGKEAGATVAIDNIANQCRQVESFAVRRTGFDCKRVDK